MLFCFDAAPGRWSCVGLKREGHLLAGEVSCGLAVFLDGLGLGCDLGSDLLVEAVVLVSAAL